MRDIWHLQSRLTVKFGKKPEILLEHKRFRAAYDFLLLREESGEELDDLGAWWTEFQENAPSKRAEMSRDAPRPKRKRRRKRRSRNGNKRTPQ